MYYFDKLLAGPDALQNLRAETLLFDFLTKIARDLIIDIRRKQSQPHLTHRIRDIALAQLAKAAQLLKDSLKFFSEKVGHRKVK